MNCVLFCQHSYSYGILNPIKIELIKRNYSFTWFITKNLIDDFPYQSDPIQTDINELKKQEIDAIFVPGNYIPHYLKGVKVQVFHGLAGEKKAHFKIRDYFDLYLTQGPFFTKRFLELKEKHKNFDVVETGWSKLDKYFNQSISYIEEKAELISKFKVDRILLYAPTFNEHMISAPYLLEEFDKLMQNKSYLLLVKFHLLTSEEICNAYELLAQKHDRILISKEPDISKLMLIADLLISDTSSVVYEFQLLDKPVITYNSKATSITWDNSTEYTDLIEKVNKNLNSDVFKKNRIQIIADYHPYNDGNSSKRMIEAVENYITLKGVPQRRKVSLSKKFKIFKIFTLRNK